MFELQLTYESDDVPNYDFECSLESLINTEHSSSTFDSGQRGIKWQFESEKEAHKAQRKLKKLKSPFKFKMSVEIIQEAKNV